MRFRVVILLALVVIAVLLLPSVAAAGGATAVRAGGHGGHTPPLPDPPATLGKPWTGSWMRMSPNSLKKTKSRTVWVEIAGFFNTWADGAPNGTQAQNGYIVALMPSFTGARFVDWGVPMQIGFDYDRDHPRGCISYFCGRVKLRLPAGYGKKVIKLRFEAIVTNEHNNITFDPLNPFSPTYRTKVTRVR